jgi:hypothetical protein
VVPERAARRVDLPDPDGPRTPQTVPAGTWWLDGWRRNGSSEEEEKEEEES